MKTEIWEAVDRYYESLFVPANEKFSEIEESVRNAGMPEIAISPLYGQLMDIIIKVTGIQHVLEIGTLGGYSTAWLARALPPEGSLISLEIDPQRAALARENLETFDFCHQVEIREGDALQGMAEMVETNHPPFDLIFIDGEKSQYPDYLDLSVKLSKTGTLIIADNVVKHGRVFNQVIDTPSRVGITAFHERVAENPRLQAAVLQTVGEKGHDGLAFILVKDDPRGNQ